MGITSRKRIATREMKRVRARLILMGDMFKPIVEALDSGASPEAIASIIVDIVDADEDRLIRMREVVYLTGLSRPSVIRKADNPKDDFPSAMRLGISARGWHLWEVRSWLRTRART